MRDAIKELLLETTDCGGVGERRWWEGEVPGGGGDGERIGAAAAATAAAWGAPAGAGLAAPQSEQNLPVAEKRLWQSTHSGGSAGSPALGGEAIADPDPGGDGSGEDGRLFPALAKPEREGGRGREGGGCGVVAEGGVGVGEALEGGVWGSEGGRGRTAHGWLGTARVLPPPPPPPPPWAPWELGGRGRSRSGLSRGEGTGEWPGEGWGDLAGERATVVVFVIEVLRGEGMGGRLRWPEAGVDGVGGCGCCGVTGAAEGEDADAAPDPAPREAESLRALSDEGLAEPARNGGLAALAGRGPVAKALAAAASSAVTAGEDASSAIRRAVPTAPSGLPSSRLRSHARPSEAQVARRPHLRLSPTTGLVCRATRSTTG